ncbi:MAG: hypothetical protein PHN18_10090 [Sulfurospirillaceae bacterium]|nr:hypothetical protein [Sulfurospirillaceae bacterium]MDD2827004.1 hypothetical protein [Sulfurospirillaceae bacterium]
MQKMKLITGVIASLWVPQIMAQSMDTLLDTLAQKDDLSVYTKNEVAGYIKIFTREDLDRMKIRSFDELIDKIPFLRNRQDNLGLTDPNYKYFQPNNPATIRFFINDREILTPLFGSAFRMLGQLDMSYIDHVEVYHGFPSYEISMEPTGIIIKAYSKVGKRENIATLGSSIGNYGTTDTYGYISETRDDYSYFEYVNHRDLNRAKVENLGSELSRDKEATSLYSGLSNDTSLFEVQFVNGNLDNFAGNSWTMTPLNVTTNFKYFGSNYAYTSLDKSLKASFQYTYLTDEYYDTSLSPLGIVSSTTAPFYMPYYTQKQGFTEHLFDSQVTKRYIFGDTSVLVGLKNRYKKFNFDTNELNGISYLQDIPYNSEDVASLFTEVKHTIDDKHQLILSLSGQRYFEKDAIKEDNLWGTRLGYIYSEGDFTQKSFIFYGSLHPSPYVLLMNNQYSLGLNTLENEKISAISTQSLWKAGNSEYSLLVSHFTYKNQIIYDISGYHNLQDTLSFNTISFTDVYMFNNTDRIDFNAWILDASYDNNNFESGGYVALYAKFLGLDTYNSLSYVNGIDDIPAGWNYDATITYPYSKQLSIFLKGRNLLHKAFKSNYMSINPLTMQVSTLNHISNVDRTLWLGFEYSF